MRDSENLAWEMFAQTGNISYYKLYKDLKRNGRKIQGDSTKKR